MRSRPKIVAFDIIGTVFSLEAFEPKLARLGLPAGSTELLYTFGLRDAFALACANRFAPFRSVLEGALDDLLALRGRSATPDEKSDVLDTLRTLPAYPDAAAAFQVLADAGVRILALSNGARANTEALLTKASLRDKVEQIISVDDIQLSKPRAEVYRHAVRSAAVAPGEMALVACHPWDLMGAMAAGLQGAYVDRGRPFPVTLGTPDVTGDTLLAVARALTA